MTLSPMRFKNYIWPHNPRSYSIDFRRTVVSRKVPGGRSLMQDMGLDYRVLRGEGEFCGEGAYDEFKKLAMVFYEDSPGVLTHPVWQTSMAWFVELSLTQEPTEDYVAYSFEFWECSTISTASSNNAAGVGAVSEKRWHTVAAGETIWSISALCGVTVPALIRLNTRLKNPNNLAAGDRLRIR